jgi:hypothetical protein
MGLFEYPLRIICVTDDYGKLLLVVGTISSFLCHLRVTQHTILVDQEQLRLPQYPHSMQRLSGIIFAPSSAFCEIIYQFKILSDTNIIARYNQVVRIIAILTKDHFKSQN